MSESHNQAVTAAIALLAETFPECFSVYEGRPRPLKIGIHLDILAAVNGALTPLELSKALGATAPTAPICAARARAPSASTSTAIPLG